MEAPNWILRVPTDEDGPISAGVDIVNNFVSFDVNINSVQTVDYTCGDTKTELPKRAYPLILPTYISNVLSGNWNEASSWLKVGGGPEVPVVGSLVQVRASDVIDFDVDAINVYSLEIGGKVTVGTTKKHNLGNVTGTGTIKMINGQFPGGSYDDFLTTTGGSVEFAGATDYVTSTRVKGVRNLLFSGTGTRTIPLLSTTVGDLLEIGSTVAVDNTVNNSTFDLEGDFEIVSGGTFSSGTGGLNFVGSKDSYVRGSISGVNELAQVSLNKTVGDVYIDGTSDLSVKNAIDFVNGRIISEGNKVLMGVGWDFITPRFNCNFCASFTNVW